MKILIVDGSTLVREKLIKYLNLENLFDEVLRAETVREAKYLLQTKNIDVILLDIQLQNESGLELVDFSKKLFHAPIMIICSNYRFPQYRNVYLKKSVSYFFDKSSELVELKKFISQLAADLRRLNRHFFNKQNQFINEGMK